MYFDTHRDACMRLEGTIIIYRGKAAIVNSVNENLTLRLTRLHDGKEFNSVKQTSQYVELRAPCLGYINLPKGAVFAMRTPARMWKQGLSLRSVKFKHAMIPPHMLRAETIAHCLDGEYPTLEQATKMFKSTNPFNPDVPKAVAFSRKWAVGKEGELFYKGDRVGEAGDRPMLSDKYVWLAEDLQEALDANNQAVV